MVLHTYQKEVYILYGAIHDSDEFYHKMITAFNVKYPSDVKYQMVILKKCNFYRTELIVVVLVTDAWLTELRLESYASFWRRSNSALFAIPL